MSRVSALASAMIFTARQCTTLPTSVRLTPAGPRTNSASPMCTSSAWICRDSDGCETCSTSAAWPMLPYSATQAKYISWRNEGIAFDQLMIGKLASVTDIAYIPLAGNTGRIGTDRETPGRRDERPPAAFIRKPFRGRRTKDR